MLNSSLVGATALMKQMDEAFPVYEKWGVVIEKRQVNRYARLRVALAPAGGYAGRFVPVN